MYDSFSCNHFARDCINSSNMPFNKELVHIDTRNTICTIVSFLASVTKIVTELFMARCNLAAAYISVNAHSQSLVYDYWSFSL